jgi:hypothetical protein
MSGYDRRNVFRATASFEQMAAFSKAYMAEHTGEIAKFLPDNLIFVMEASNDVISAGPIDEDDQPVDMDDDDLYEMRVEERYYGFWRGYSCDVPYGFKWESCSESVLVAHQIDDELFEVECRPPHMRVNCGFMELLEAEGVEFIAVETKPENDQDRDVEPEWCPFEFHNDRPASNC